MNNMNISIESDTKVQGYQPGQQQTAVTTDVMKYYAHRATETKEKIDQLGAEVSQRQDKMSLIIDIISDINEEINKLKDDKSTLDISQIPSLLENLRRVRELGVKITEGKVKFSSTERERLLENLNLAGEKWDKENKNQTQKMEIYIKDLDRILMLLKDVQKCENTAIRGASTGIKGG